MDKILPEPPLDGVELTSNEYWFQSRTRSKNTTSTWKKPTAWIKTSMPTELESEAKNAWQLARMDGKHTDQLSFCRDIAMA